MPAHRLKESFEAVHLARQGMKTRQIADKLGVSYSAAHGYITRGIKRGELPDRQKRQWATAVTELYFKHRVIIGRIGLSVESWTPEVRAWAANETCKHGFSSISEWLCDLAIEEYFRTRVGR